LEAAKAALLKDFPAAARSVLTGRCALYTVAEAIK
jgi:hypothetical protein